MSRPDGRAPGALRPYAMRRHFQRYPAGSVLIEMGGTRVICAASVENRVPFFQRGTGEGWIAAEYALLPSATSTRTPREAVRGRQNGRTQEIQRLIGRALRSVVDLKALGERTIQIDCDVIQADGGTRTASITGAFVALVEACASFYEKGGTEEDAHAIVDMNVVMTGDGRFIEVQGTGEGRPFSRAELSALLDYAEQGCRELISHEKDVLGGELVWLVGRVG